MREWVAQGVPFVAEPTALRDVMYVDLPIGRWPQFTTPVELARVTLAAVQR